MAASPDNLEQAVAILRRGGLVAFPTETVYGLGADARNPAAIARLYAVKGRPRTHPLIVHLGRSERLDRWAREVSPAALALAATFWPGPLTLVLRRANGVPDAVTGGQDSVGLRMPAHPLALELLARFAGGIAAPSANRFGRVSPTTADHVREDLGSDVDLVLDGGACEVGIESTIVDLSRGAPVILRPGRITAEQIEKATGATPRRIAGPAPRAPGALPAHYAPRRPLKLVESADWDRAAVMERDKRLAVLCFREKPPGDSGATWITAARDPEKFAHDLYANLRLLDAAGCDLILVEAPPRDPQWTGVNDRLARAAKGDAPSAP